MSGSDQMEGGFVQNINESEAYAKQLAYQVSIIKFHENEVNDVVFNGEKCPCKNTSINEYFAVVYCSRPFGRGNIKVVPIVLFF